jgi:hypothetical protein
MTSTGSSATTRPFRFRKALLHVDAHFDNSANNKFNPNPDKTVYYGTMTWEEMMFPFFGVVVPKNTDPRKIIKSAFEFAGGGG